MKTIDSLLGELHERDVRLVALERYVKQLETALVLERATRLVMVMPDLGAEEAHTDRLLAAARAELLTEEVLEPGR